jgi:hypothetical protein
MWGLQGRNGGFKEEKSIYLAVWGELQSIQPTTVDGLLLKPNRIRCSLWTHVLPVAILENVWKLDRLLGIITELPAAAAASFLNWKIHIRFPDALRRWSRGKMISNFEAYRKSFHWRVPIRYAAVHGSSRPNWTNANLKASKTAMWTHRLVKGKRIYF